MKEKNSDIGENSLVLVIVLLVILVANTLEFKSGTGWWNLGLSCDCAERTAEVRR